MTIVQLNFVKLTIRAKKIVQFSLFSRLLFAVRVTKISDLFYLHIHVHIAYMVWTLLTASEATMASKQPRRSDLTSYLKSVTSITYISMCILLICFGPILRPLQPPNGLIAQILPQIWNLWPKLDMQPCLFGLFRPFLEVSPEED